MSLEIQRPVEAMALLEALLHQRRAVFEDNAQPIQFDFGEELWNFEPGRSGARCQRGPHSQATLTIHCSPNFLGRLLLQPEVYLTPGEELKLIGDTAAFGPLVKALGGSSPKAQPPTVDF